MEYEGIIYRYKSPSGKYYIGQTVNEKRRRERFLYDKNYGGPKINRARKKYGPENFEYAVLMKVTGDDIQEIKKTLDTIEIGFIRMYDSVENGYNIVKGGGGCVGFHHSESTKEKMSESHKKSHKKKPLSEETKKKISEALKGRPAVYGMKGKHHSIETKKKMSESHKGKRGPYNKKKDGITLYPLW